MGVGKINSKKWVLPLLLFLAVGGAYANSLSSGFVWDDKPLIIGKQEFFSHPRNALALLVLPDVVLGARQTPPYYRPLDTLSYMLDHYLWGGKNPFWYHLENVLLHGVVVVLFYFLLMEVFEDKRLAFFAAVLFAVYPVNTEAVDFVSARNTLFCAVFSLASLLLLAKGGARWTLLSFLSYFIALLSKELAVVLPFFLLSLSLTGGFASCEEKKKFKVKKTVLAGFFALTAVYFVIRHFVLGAFIARHGIGFSPDRLKLIAAVLFEHFRLFVFPFKLNALYTEKILSFSMIKAASAGVGVLLLLYFSLKKKTPGPVRAGAQWILWGLLPVSNIVKIPSAPVAERYQYMVLLGFVLILGYLIETLSRRKAALGLAVLAALSLALGLRTFERNFVWKDDTSLYASMIRSDPADAAAYYDLGNFYGEHGDLEDAKRQFRAALVMDPGYIKARVNLGIAYAKEDRFKEAIQEFTTALAIDPNHVMARVNLGMAYVEEGRFPEALAEFRTALVLDPLAPEAHLALAIGYEKQGLLSEAESQFQTVLKLAPGNARAVRELNFIKAENGSWTTGQ